VTVSVPTTDDTIDEPTETFTLNGTVTSGNTANTSASGTGTILDNDAAPSISISDVTVTEGQPAVFVVSIAGVSSVDTVVNVVTTTGTAGTADYTTTTATVTIPAGQTSVTVSVPTTDDTIDEPTETFTLNGTVTSGNTSNTTASGTGTILDNDAAPTVSISDVTVTEGANAVFTISLSNPSSVDTVVDVVTATGTAGTEDYTTTTVTVTIPAGQTSVTVSVPTTDDTINEPTEYFTLNGTVISGNTSNTNPVGTATIIDNDIVTNITGHIYADNNGNGTQDAGEPNLAGIAVLITDANGVTQTVTTDTNGNWTASVQPELPQQMLLSQHYRFIPIRLKEQTQQLLL
jgi:hypothetical protein